jgi:hypothetical protein
MCRLNEYDDSRETFWIYYSLRYFAWFNLHWWFLSSFFVLFCFVYAVFPPNDYILCDHFHVQCPMCRAIAGCVNFRTMLHTGFELSFRWFHRVVTQNEPPLVHVSGELEPFIWRRRCTSCTSDPSYRMTWNTSLVFFLIKTELIHLKSQITNQYFNDQGNISFASLLSVPFHFANYCSKWTEHTI